MKRTDNKIGTFNFSIDARLTADRLTGKYSNLAQNTFAADVRHLLTSLDIACQCAKTQTEILEFRATLRDIARKIVKAHDDALYNAMPVAEEEEIDYQPHDEGREG